MEAAKDVKRGSVPRDLVMECLRHGMTTCVATAEASIRSWDLVVKQVSRVDLETVLSAEAYILFYARHTPRGASLVRNTHSDGKSKRDVEAISKKKNQKTKLSCSNRNASHWMSPNDFTGADVVDPEGWEFHPKHTNHTVDSSSDSSSIFSVSDAGSYSTDSTKDSSVEEDLSGYLFGSNWYHP